MAPFGGLWEFRMAPIAGVIVYFGVKLQDKSCDLKNIMNEDGGKFAVGSKV